MSHKTSPDSLKDIPSGDKLSFWHKYEHKHLDKLLYRTIHLRNNSDYRIRYPNECRNVEIGKIHPEAKIRIFKEHKHQLEKSMVPTTERPKRFNRIA